MNYYERHLGDYARDAGHLSLLEEGVYTRLLDRYYATEQPLPAAQVYRVTRATTALERAAVDQVLSDFFSRDGELWRHKRCDAEIARASDKRLKAAASAKARWTANELFPQSDGSADAMRTHCEGNAHQSPGSNHQSPDKSIGRFDAFWTAYPKKTAKQDALKAWNRHGLDRFADQIIADVAKRKTSHRPWLEGFVPNPATYLNGARWNDDIETPKANGKQQPAERATPRKEIT